MNPIAKSLLAITTAFLAIASGLQAQAPVAEFFGAIDNQGEVFLNGTSVATGNTWQTLIQGRRLPLRDGVNTIAIRATNTGGPAGVLAEIRVGGRRLVSSSAWKVTNVLSANWQTPGFDDSAWSGATEFGSYGVAPWGLNVGGFPADTAAKWIWSATVQETGTVYLRYTFRVSPEDAQTAFGDAGFETPVQAANGFTYAPTGGSWTFTGRSAITRSGSAFTNQNPAAPEGLQVAALENIASEPLNGGVITQSRTLRPGLYRVRFSAAQRAYNYGPQTVVVSVDNVEIGRIVPAGLSYATYQTAGTFTAGTAPVTLKLAGTGRLANGQAAPDITAFVDDVQLISLNTPPVVTAPGDQRSVRGAAVALAIVARDAENPTLTFSATGLPAGLAIDARSGSISGTVAANAAAANAVTVTVSDGVASAATSFAWAIDPPVVTAPGDQRSIRGAAVTLAIVVRNAENLPFTFSATGLPAGLAIDARSGSISGTVAASAAAANAVTVTVSDGVASTATNFAWAIDPPVVTTPGDQRSVRGAAVALAIVVRNAENLPFTFSATGLPAGLAIDERTGSISGTVAASAATANAVTVTVSDGVASTATSFAWAIDPGLVAALEDDFSGAQLDANRWLAGSRYVAQAGVLDPGVTVAQSDGQLVITPQTGVAGGTYNGILATNAVDFRGGAVSVRVRAGQGAALGWLALGRGQDFLVMSVTEGQLYAEQTVDGVQDYLSVAYDAVAQSYWRIRHDSGTDEIVYETGPDGLAWTAIRRAPRRIAPEALAALQAELVAGTYDATPAPGVVTFDDFRFQPNRAPSLTAPAGQSWRAGTTVALAIAAGDADAQTLRFSATGLPEGLVIDPATGAIAGRPTVPGTGEITVTVSDGLLTASASFAWEVRRATVPAFAEDFADPAIDSLRWSPGSRYVELAGGVLDPAVTVAAPDGRLVITPAANAAGGRYNGLLSNDAVDLHGAAVSLVVEAAEDPAVTWFGLVQGQDALLMAVSAGSLFLEQTAGGVQDSTSVPYEGIQQRFWRIRHDSGTDQIVYEASPDGVSWTELRRVARRIGIDVLQIELIAGTYDATAAPGAATFDTLRYQPNRQPELIAPAAPTLRAGQAAALPAQAFDADGQTLAFAATGLLRRLTLDAATGQISGIPTTPGTSQVTLSVSDGLLTASVGFSWTILNSNGLPDGFSTGDIGAARIAGTTSADGGVVTQTSSGLGVINNGSDQFQYAWQQFVGEGEIIARVTSQTATDPAARAGVMLRETTLTNARFAALFLTPGKGIVFETRSATGALTKVVLAPRVAAPNNWLRLIRSGDTVTAYRSADGVRWTQIASLRLVLSRALTAGLAASSKVAGVVTTATYDNLRIASPALPAPWSGGDIGTPALTELERFAGGTFTVSGGGAGYTGRSDAGHFTAQALTGNGEIIARVASQSVTNPWAKAGVMIRESDSANSPMALLTLTEANGIYLQTRATAGAAVVNVVAPRGDRWLRLVRSGSTLTAYRSADGQTWTLVGTSTVNFSATVSIGLAVTSSNSPLLSTATFDNVVVVVNPLP